MLVEMDQAVREFLVYQEAERNARINTLRNHHTNLYFGYKQIFQESIQKPIPDRF